MMKNILFISVFISWFCSAQVGINTTSPTRMLDHNGDLRVRTLTDKTADNSYGNVIVADSNGNLDKWDKNDLKYKVQELILENKKLTYVSNSPDINNSMDCGRFSFRYDTGTHPQIKLISGNSTTVYYTILHKVNSSNSSFSWPNTMASGQSVTIGSGSTVDTNGWQTLDSSYANNTLDELYITYPGDNNLYRVTFLARNSNSTQFYYTMICEKF